MYKILSLVIDVKLAYFGCVNDRFLFINSINLFTYFKVMYRVINTNSILARGMAIFFSPHSYIGCKIHLESHVSSVAECNDISKVLQLYCFHDLFKDDFGCLSVLKDRTKISFVPSNTEFHL